MIKAWCIMAACLLLFAGLVQPFCLQAQVTLPPARTVPPSVHDFFKALVEHYDPSSLPTNEDVLKVTDQIAGARSGDVIQGGWAYIVGSRTSR
jgi:hypothetical protein